MITKKLIQNNLNAHLLWKLRFEFAISGQVPIHTPSPVLSADDQCPFGKWLYGPTLSSEDMEGGDFENVRELHAQFHKIAGQMQDLIDKNEVTKARELLLGEFDQSSKELVTALEAWMENPLVHSGDSIPFGLDTAQNYVPVCRDHGSVFLKVLLDVTQACIPVHEVHRERFNGLVQLA